MWKEKNLYNLTKSKKYLMTTNLELSKFPNKKKEKIQKDLELQDKKIVKVQKKLY